MRRRAVQWSCALGVLLVALQAARLPTTNPPVESDLAAPPDVKQALQHACYDCHSNQTRWPWYTDVAPISWLVHHDVSEGRRRLNFSSWADYTSDPGTEAHKLEEIARFVASGEMAPWYYRWLHPDAHLDERQRGAIARWIAQTTASLPPSS